MFTQIIIRLHEQKLSDFDFLKEHPTKAYKKGNWFALIYYEPLGVFLDEQASTSLLISTTEDYRDLEKSGWIVIRDFPIKLLSGDLLEFLTLYDSYRFAKNRNGNGLDFNGQLLHFVAFGLNSRIEVIEFVKLMVGAGYGQSIIIQVFANIVKNKSLASDFLELLQLYKEKA